MLPRRFSIGFWVGLPPTVVYIYFFLMGAWAALVQFFAPGLGGLAAFLSPIFLLISVMLGLLLYGLYVRNRIASFIAIFVIPLQYFLLNNSLTGYLDNFNPENIYVNLIKLFCLFFILITMAVYVLEFKDNMHEGTKKIS